MLPGETKTLPVENCARCGGSHEATFKPFTTPCGRHTHWALCVATGEPIMQTTFNADVAQEVQDIVNQIRGMENRILELCGDYAPLCDVERN